MTVVEGTSYTLLIVGALGFAGAVLYAAVNELFLSPKEYVCYNQVGCCVHCGVAGQPGNWAAVSWRCTTRPRPPTHVSSVFCLSMLSTPENKEV